LDQFRIQAVMYAERRCRKLKMGQVAFSPEIAKARTLIQAWLLLDKHAKVLKGSSRLLQCTMKKAELPPSHRHLSLAIISTNLKSAYTSYYSIKPDHICLHKDSLQDLAEAMAQEGNTQKETIVRLLLQREQQRASARYIRYLRGKFSSNNATMVTIHDTEGNKFDLTSRPDIEATILQNNKDRFQQSFHTPFL